MPENSQIQNTSESNLSQENTDLRAKVEALEKQIHKLKAPKPNRISRFFYWFTKRVAINFFLGTKLEGNMKQVFKELGEKKIPTGDTLAKLVTAIILRFTRIGLLAFIVAITPTIILLVQTRYLWQQNKYIQQQNKYVKQQTYLAEGSRRSSLVFLMSNVMDQLNEEVKDTTKNPQRKLSPQLIGRIIALAGSFKPYQFLEGDTLSKPLSPERGQLLVTLIKSQIDSISFDLIKQGASFEYADLKDASLFIADLRGADLRYAGLIGAYLSGADLRDADLSGADLSKANLWGAYLSGADLRYAGLIGAYLSGADLRDADLRDADLRDAGLRGADLREADLRYAGLRGANLREADLSKAYLSKADLRGAKVDSTNWFEKLKALPEEEKPRGLEQIMKKYYIDPEPRENWYGDTYYLIKEKPSKPKEK